MDWQREEHVQRARILVASGSDDSPRRRMAVVCLTLALLLGRPLQRLSEHRDSRRIDHHCLGFSRNHVGTMGHQVRQRIRGKGRAFEVRMAALLWLERDCVHNHMDWLVDLASGMAVLLRQRFQRVSESGHIHSLAAHCRRCLRSDLGHRRKKDALVVTGRTECAPAPTP